MTINLKNFLSSNEKTSKMGDFQELKDIAGLQVSSVSADLYKNGRDDLSLFYFPEGSNHAVAYTKNSIVSESIIWNRNNTKNDIKALVVNTKNANTFTGKQGKESLDIIAKNLSRILTLKESKSAKGTSETVKIKDLIFASTGVIGEKFPVDKIPSQIILDNSEWYRNGAKILIDKGYIEIPFYGFNNSMVATCCTSLFLLKDSFKIMNLSKFYYPKFSKNYINEWDKID